MKFRLGKKVLACLLSSCMAFTAMAVPLKGTGKNDSSTVSASIIASIGTKIAGNIYSAGFSLAGKTLTSIAAATGNEGLEKVASIINVWIFGGKGEDKTAELCNQILEELDMINDKMDAYTGTILQAVANGNHSNLVKNMNDTWTEDVSNILSNNNTTLSNKAEYAFNAYFNFDDLDSNSNKSPENVSYLVAAYYYKNGMAYNGYSFTEENIINKKEKLFNEFCKIQGINLSLDKATRETMLYEDKSEDMSDNKSTLFDVDTVLPNTIKNLTSKLKKTGDDTYADACAKVANDGILDVSEQYEFVQTNLNKQVMVICLTEMLYQEYLSMRGEYLEEKYPDESVTGYADAWNKYNLNARGNETGTIDGLEDYNNNVLTAIENCLSTPLKLDDNGKTCALINYVKPQDLEGVVLHNTTFKSTFTAEDYESEELIHEIFEGNIIRHSSDAYGTSENMEFYKLPVFTDDGLRIYYIRTDKAVKGKDNDGETSIMLIDPDDDGAPDINYPGCDYFNLARGKYSDGSNEYSCADSNEDSRYIALFDSNYYNLTGTVPSAYLSEYLSSCTEDISNYQLFNMYVDGGQKFLCDYNFNFVAIDMDTANPDIAKANTKELIGHYISEYDNEDDEDQLNDGFYASFVLAQNESELSNKVSVETIKDGKTINDGSCYLKDGNGNKIENNSKIKCGENMTLYLSTSCSYDTIKILRHNDASDLSKVTSEETLLSGDEYQNLKLSNDGNYYMLNISMPYSNCTIQITEIPYMETDDNGRFIIESYQDLVDMSDNVNNGIEKYMNGDYIVVNDIECPADSDFTPVGTKDKAFKGSFNGGGFTISNLTIKADDSYQGLFGFTSGAVIENFTLSGNVDCVSSTIKAIGGVAGAAGDGTAIRNVNSAVNITNSSGYMLSHVGGVVGELLNSSTIDKTVFSGSITLEKSHDCFGGIAGYANEGVKITNSANLGNVTVKNGSEDPFVGGILGYVNNAEFAGLQNCYNYGTVSSDRNSYLGAIVGWARDNTSCKTILNNYYLDTSCENAFGKSGNSGSAESKTAEQFAEGEVSFLLNDEITDGLQVWYQNLDNGLTPDIYPVLVNNTKNTVYKVDLSDKTYSKSTADTEPPLILNSDIRTYLRISDFSGDYSTNIIYGFGNVDEKTKTITVYATVNDSVVTEKVGILKHQGPDGKSGIIELLGDYPVTKETSAEFLKQGIEEPDIYTDGNGCIFVTIPEDGSTVSGLRVKYTPKGTEENISAEYNLQVVTTEVNPESKKGVSVANSLQTSDPDYQTWNSLSTLFKSILIGDITQNGVHDLYDAIEIAKSILQIRTFTSHEKKIADFDGNGVIDLYDAIAVARVLLPKN